MTPEDFIRANAALAAPPLVPEIRLYLASEVVPLWCKTEDQLARSGVPPPYWAFAWAGGQALARHVLDDPAIVRGKRVLDLGAGCGLVGIAAAKMGAARVLAADIDPFACAAIALNAAANAVEIAVTSEDLIGAAGSWETILVGDLFYERPLAETLLPWLTKSKADVLLGDPGRSYFPQASVERLALYKVPTSRELEDSELRETGVWRLAK
ncbi:MAG TPA: 50S ribosomal protein L11 methyltransferase [Rhizomicrobium sp.]|jgi:predicted nicotinamide N-methyase|nr:50S ribosomal protein L11 methyltransferase [Rhizomicrobium sp.]